MHQFKQKVCRGNDAPFMNRELRKAVYTRSRLKNKLGNNPTHESKIAYKRQRNVCVTIGKKAVKSHFKTVACNGVTNNKEFWKIIKPFITNKGGLNNNEIILIENEKIISEEKQLTGIFNDHYINIVEEN